MNINIFKNLCANAYKPNGIEKFLSGDWWHHVLTDKVGSTSRLLFLIQWSLNQHPPKIIINTGEKNMTSKDMFESVFPQGKQIGGNHYKNFNIQPYEFISKNDLSFFREMLSSMCVVIKIKMAYKT
jgi:hypothetical protein